MRHTGLDQIRRNVVELPQQMYRYAEMEDNEVDENEMDYDEVVGNDEMDDYMQIGGADDEKTDESANKATLFQNHKQKIVAFIVVVIALIIYFTVFNKPSQRGGKRRRNRKAKSSRKSSRKSRSSRRRSKRNRKN